MLFRSITCYVVLFCSQITFFFHCKKGIIFIPRVVVNSKWVNKACIRFPTSIIIAFPSLHYHQRLYLTSTCGITHLENSSSSFKTLLRCFWLYTAFLVHPHPSTNGCFPFLNYFCFFYLFLLLLYISKCCNTK